MLARSKSGACRLIAINLSKYINLLLHTLQQYSMHFDKESKIFEALFSENYERLCRYVVTILGDYAIAEDIVQDIFAKMWVNRSKTSVSQIQLSYLYRSAYNTSLDYLKHHSVKSNYEVLQLQLLVVADHENVQLDFDLFQKVDQAIEKLAPQCKKIFKLSRFEGLTYNEIAIALNISVNTVDTQIRRALSSLKKELSEYLILVFVFFRHFL